MNIKDFIDWQDVEDNAEIGEDVERLELDHDCCLIQCGDNGVEVVLSYGASNVCHSNDPDLSGITLTIVLDENLKQIDSEAEYF